MREGPQRREGTTCVLPSPTVVTGATSLSILAFFLLQSTCALLPPWLLLLFSFSTSTLYSLSLSLAFLQLTLAQSRSPNPSTSLSLTCFSPINPCSVSLTQSIHLYVLFLPPLPPSWLSFLFYFRFTSLVLLLLFLSLLSSHLLPLLRVSFTSRASCCSGLWSKRLPSKICSFL
jgi:hypothetical protein